MNNTDHDPEHDDVISQGRQERPAWVDGQAPDPGRASRRERRVRVPVSGRQEDDGLWTHVTEAGGLLALATWIAAITIPRSVPLWMITSGAATITAVTWWQALSLTGSVAMAMYLGAWGAVLTGWLTAARMEGPWHAPLVFALVLPVLILIASGVTVIRRHRDRVQRITEAGRENVNARECTYWEGLLQRFGMSGVTVRDVIRMDGGKQVHCRLGKFTADGRKPTTIEGVRELAGLIVQQLRLNKGAVYIEEEPAGGTSADFVIHLRMTAGPRLARYLPAENGYLSITRKFGLGVFDTGREFQLKLREIRVFICGLIGSGKSTLINVFIAQLCRMPDALIFVIDLKGGQEMMAWLMPFLKGITDRPVIDWLATTRGEADIMLDALMRAGQARARSGRYGKKLRPTLDHPAFIVLCDETTVMTGHQIREDDLSNTKLAVKLLQIEELFRSVGIDVVISSVRGFVENTGKTGLKAMSDAKIGMRVSTVDEGRAIFPDNLQAARQLAQLKDKGMGIPKIGPVLHPPVHFYNITDGEPDDDGNPTEDRITPIVLATTDRRPQPEQLARDAMGEDYAKRWEQPGIKALAAGWLAAAGEASPPQVPPPPAPSQRPAGSQDDPLEAMVRADPELRELNRRGFALPGDDDPRRGLNPVRKRMYELLIGRGREGWRVDPLWHTLQAGGDSVARQTLHAWLAEDEKLGYVIRTGSPRHRWVWWLPEGAEFDIPGWD